MSLTFTKLETVKFISKQYPVRFNTLFLLSAGWCRTSWLGLLKRIPWFRLWWIPRETSSTPARRRAPSASTTSGPLARPWRRSPAWRHRYGLAKRCVNMICCTHGEKAPSASTTSGPMARPWRRSPAWRHRYGLAKRCVGIVCSIPGGERATSASVTSDPIVRPWKRSQA